MPYETLRIFTRVSALAVILTGLFTIAMGLDIADDGKSVITGESYEKVLKLPTGGSTGKELAQLGVVLTALGIGGLRVTR